MIFVITLAQLVITIIAGLLMARHTRFRWAAIPVVLIGLVIGAAHLQANWRLADTIHICQKINTMFRMYEAESRYDRAGSTDKDMYRRELLIACYRVQSLAQGDITRAYVEGVDQNPHQVVDRAQVIARIRISELDPDHCKRAKAFEQMLDPDRGGGILHDWERVWRMLGKPSVFSDGSSLRKLGNYSDRVIAYCLSSCYARRGQYELALERLERALGKNWASSGVVDQWWAQNLPPRPEDHLFFGYVLYKTGNKQTALREFRKAKGQRASMEDAERFFKSAPM